ncbi:MAG: helical backbone metal receptor [Clostridiales bacterium]|jgi:iron complex transport system substrate-binding protein|nr:helical backbone metal receptor [Clostridiales bacterium]
MNKKFTKAVMNTSILILSLILAFQISGCKKPEPIAQPPVSSEITSDEPSEPSATSSEIDAAEPSEPSAASSEITVTDMTGREVKLTGTAEKIVVLSPSDCEILYALGAGGAVVGRGEYCDYPAEVSQVPAVQSGSETNIEQIIALNPQVVVMTKMSHSAEQVDAIENAGIRVVSTDAQNIAGVYQAIELIGKITGRDSQASALVGEMKSGFEEIKAQAANAGSVSDNSVYFEVSPLEWGLWTAGKNTFMDEIAQITGLKNAFDDIEGWAEISEEQVIDRNPAYIFTITMYFEGTGQVHPVDEIAGRGGWENIGAVKNSNIFLLDSNEISRPGPRLYEAAKKVYEIVYAGSGN